MSNTNYFGSENFLNYGILYFRTIILCLVQDAVHVNLGIFGLEKFGDQFFVVFNFHHYCQSQPICCEKFQLWFNFHVFNFQKIELRRKFLDLRYISHSCIPCVHMQLLTIKVKQSYLAQHSSYTCRACCIADEGPRDRNVPSSMKKFAMLS